MRAAIKIDAKGKLTVAERQRIKAIHGRLRRRGSCDMDADEFREWLISQALVSPELRCIWPCAYHMATKTPAAGGYMMLKDVQIDHDIPVSRFGRGTRENLKISCATCNQRKGSLTGEEFSGLCLFVNRMSEEAQVYILQKLSQKPAWK